MIAQRAKAPKLSGPLLGEFAQLFLVPDEVVEELSRLAQAMMELKDEVILSSLMALPGHAWSVYSYVCSRREVPSCIALQAKDRILTSLQHHRVSEDVLDQWDRVTCSQEELKECESEFIDPIVLMGERFCIDCAEYGMSIGVSYVGIGRPLVELQGVEEDWSSYDMEASTENMGQVFDAQSSGTKFIGLRLTSQEPLLLHVSKQDRNQHLVDCEIDKMIRIEDLHEKRSDAFSGLLSKLKEEDWI